MVRKYRASPSPPIFFITRMPTHPPTLPRHSKGPPTVPNISDRLKHNHFSSYQPAAEVWVESPFQAVYHSFPQIYMFPVLCFIRLFFTFII